MNFARKKSFILISLLLVSLLILSGCGGGSGDSVTETENTTLKAMSTTDNALKSLENENTDEFIKYAHNDDFRAEDRGTTLTLDEFVNIFKEMFATGAEFSKMDLEDATTEIITKDEVKITGVVLTSGIDESGDSFQNENTPVEFRVKNFGGSWLLTKFVFGSSSPEEVTPGPIETTDNFINAIKQENLDSLDQYVDNKSFRYIYPSESNPLNININEFISMLEQSFSAGGMYEVLYLKNTTTGADTVDEVKITGTIEASGIDADGYYFESNREVEIKINKIEGSWLLTKFVW